jgi:hypothetical protein
MLLAYLKKLRDVFFPYEVTSPEPGSFKFPGYNLGDVMAQYHTHSIFNPNLFQRRHFISRVEFNP